MAIVLDIAKSIALTGWKEARGREFGCGSGDLWIQYSASIE